MQLVIPKKRIDRLNRARAIEWLKGDSEDFVEVCILANRDPQYVKQQVQQAMRRGCKWRNDLRSVAPIVASIDYTESKQRKIRTSAN